MKRMNIVVIVIATIAAFLFLILVGPIISESVIFNSNNDSLSEHSSVFIISDENTGTAPLTVSFNSMLQDVGESVEYIWDFGDGSQSFEKNPTHVYVVKGDYICSLRVTDDDREISDDVRITVFENNPPIIKILVDKTSGNRPLTVDFNVDGFDTDGEIISYEWEIQYPPLFSYQKISTSSDKNFSEKFLRPGLYEVKLTVTDDAGNVATDYIKIQVLRHKIELLIGTSLYYLGNIKTAIDLANLVFDKITPEPPQTFLERIGSFLTVRK